MGKPSTPNPKNQVDDLLLILQHAFLLLFNASIRSLGLPVTTASGPASKALRIIWTVLAVQTWTPCPARLATFMSSGLAMA